jgi:hypothetical protein
MFQDFSASLKERLMEKRAVIRNSVLRAGTIQFGSGWINCMVHDRSNAGAMLHVTSSVGIPMRFILTMSPDGRRVSCRVAWRTEKRIGVAFERGSPRVLEP